MSGPARQRAEGAYCVVASLSGEEQALSGGLSFPQRRPELPSALQHKEEELQGVRDELQQAQEERDGHLKTISSLKQVTDSSRVPRHTPGLSLKERGRARVQCMQLCWHLPAMLSLSQEVKDTVDGQRILEKKGSAAV